MKAINFIILSILSISIIELNSSTFYNYYQGAPYVLVNFAKVAYGQSITIPQPNFFIKIPGVAERLGPIPNTEPNYALCKVVTPNSLCTVVTPNATTC